MTELRVSPATHSVNSLLVQEGRVLSHLAIQDIPLQAVWDAGFYSSPRQRKLGARCLLHQTSDITSSYSCSTKSSNTSLILIVRCNSSKDLTVTDSLLQICAKNLSSFQTWVTNSQRLYRSVWFANARRVPKLSCIEEILKSNIQPRWTRKVKLRHQLPREALRVIPGDHHWMKHWFSALNGLQPDPLFYWYDSEFPMAIKQLERCFYSNRQQLWQQEWAPQLLSDNKGMAVGVIPFVSLRIIYPKQSSE